MQELFLTMVDLAVIRTILIFHRFGSTSGGFRAGICRDGTIQCK